MTMLEKNDSGKADMKTVEIVGKNYLGEWDKLRIACRGIVIEKGNILLSYETVTGQYMLPGGGREGDESEAQCAAREFSEETGFIFTPLKCVVEIDEYYEKWKGISYYFLGEITGTCERKQTEREPEVGMEPRWVPLDEAIEIFSKHELYAEDEMKRGLYLREYTALNELFGGVN